jgi:predicted Abi (CAAX) family protease
MFLLHHPLNALTFYQAGSPTFLILANLLGLACTLVYWLTGSLWPPVLIHWIVVVVWLGWLGGLERLAQRGSNAVD